MAKGSVVTPPTATTNKRKRTTRVPEEDTEEDADDDSKEEYFSVEEDEEEEDDVVEGEEKEEGWLDTNTNKGQEATEEDDDEPYVGMAIKKLFDDSEYYLGYVVGGPTHKAKGKQSKNNPKNSAVTTWRVRYVEDDDEEDLKFTELQAYRCPIQQPYVGMMINKRFEDDQFYQGKVTEGPIKVKDPKQKSMGKGKNKKQKKGEEEDLVLNWQVLYEDGEKEDLSKEELLLWAVAPPKTRTIRSRRSASNVTPSAGNEKRQLAKKSLTTTGRRKSDSDDDDDDNDDNEEEEEAAAAAGLEEEQEEEEELVTSRVDPYCRPADNKRMKVDEIRKDLKYLVGISEEEIDAALSKMKGPPYGLNKAMQLIHQAKGGDDDYEEEDKFVPHIGMRIRKNFSGSTYYGTVRTEARKMSDPNHYGREVDMWEIEFDDGDLEDMDYQELLESRASRPMKPHPVRGRQLCMVELFSGCGMVTQAFADRKWRVKSIDNSVGSYATNLVDIMELEYDLHLGMIPDFIWASPPCFTYSLMAGGKHRDPKHGNYEITEEARLNNRFLVRLMYIMRWAKAKKPHLIVVIENPAALLAHMPLMKELESMMGLYKVPVDYCAFGRYDKKPTHLWTNSFQLRSALAPFTCKERCTSNQNHSISSRAQGHRFNSAAIPQALAEEVAACVDADFYQRRIRYEEEPVMEDDEKEEFNHALAKSDQDANAAANTRRRRRQEEEAAAAAPAPAAGTINNASEDVTEAAPSGSDKEGEAEGEKDPADNETSDNKE